MKGKDEEKLSTEDRKLLKNVYRLIAEIRKERQMTQIGLAQRTGITQTYLSQIEGGKRAVSLPVIAKLCIGLGIPLWELIWRAYFIEEAPKIGNALIELLRCLTEQINQRRINDPPVFR